MTITKWHNGSDKKKPNLSVLRCDISDMPAFAAVSEAHPINHGRHNQLTHDMRGDGGFRAGITSWEAATGLYLNGWTEGAEKVSDVAAAIGGDLLADVRGIRMRREWSDEGDELAVDRALAGSWDVAYRRTRRGMTSAPKIISVIGSVGGNCFRTQEELFWNGAQLIVASDLLEQAGYQVELRAHHTSCWGADKVHLVEVMAKEPGQPLRADAVAATFGHAGIFRTLGFGAICAAPWDAEDGLGRSTSAEVNYAKMVATGRVDECQIMIPEAFDMKSAIKNLTAALAPFSNPE